MIFLSAALYQYYRERNKNRVPMITALTDKMYPDNSNLENHLRMPIHLFLSQLVKGAGISGVLERTCRQIFVSGSSCRSGWIRFG